MSTALVYSEAQKINPSAIIELFTLQLSQSFHGDTSIYRFHGGSNLSNNGEIVWAGNSYTRMPIIADGFAYRRGQIPRPKLTISNALGSISAILNLVNTATVSGAVNTGNDLTGATVTRIRTMARFLDAVNFPGNSNPLGTPDPTAEFKREIYLVDRKATENREVVEFELAAPSDLAGVRLPKRQCTRELFPAIGTFFQ
jgi:lambda family phage minor tail protein L